MEALVAILIILKAEPREQNMYPNLREKPIIPGKTRDNEGNEGNLHCKMHSK